VLDRIVDPLIEDRLERAGPLPLDIVLSTAEIRETLLASIPPGWFARKTWVVLQAFSSYITGERDGIEFTISLAERHAAFAQLLLELLRSKLSQQLDGLPVCAGRQLFGALRALRNARRPRCVPATKRVLLDLAGPRMESEMARIVAGLPKELVLRHEDVSARLGPARMAAIDELRARVATGMVWTEEDIETLLVDAPPVVAALRRGHVEAPDLQAVAMRSADEPGQRWVALGFTVVQHPWVFEIAALVWIGIIAAMVTGPVARRVRWAASASTIAAVVAAAVLVAVRLPNPQDIGAWASFARSSWPSATAAVAGGPLPIAIAEWTHELRTTAALALLPWALVGLVARVLGASWQRGARPRRPVAAGGG
jgi:hypothetical protein